MRSLKAFDIFFLLLYSFVLGLGSFNVLKTLTELNIYIYILLVFVFYTLLFTKVVTSFRVFKNELFLLFMLFLAQVISTLMNVEDGNVSIVLNLKYFSSIILFWFLSFYFKKDSRLAIYSLFAFSLACGLLSLFTFTGFFQNQLIVNNGRLLLFGENPNSSSTRMAIAALFFFYFIIINPLKVSYLRYILFVFIFTLFIIIIQSGSRGSLLIFIFGSLILFLFSDIKKLYKVIVFSIFAIIALIIVQTIMSEDNFSIFNRIKDLMESGSIGSRKLIWNDAIKIFLDNPIFGVSEGGYKLEMISRYNYYMDTHNLFIYVLVTCGIIGFIPFILFIFLLAKKTSLKLKSGVLLPFLLFVIGFIIILKTGGVITYSVLWYVFALAGTFDFYSSTTIYEKERTI